MPRPVYTIVGETIVQRSAWGGQVIPLWAVPLIYVVVSFTAGFSLPRLEYVYLRGYEHGMSVASAQAFLSAVSSGMMALTAITFSIAFLVIQFTATAYSKRFVLLRQHNAVLAHALGMCFATFVYALATLTWVDRYRNGAVPALSTILVSVLLVASLILLALLVHSLTELRVTRVLRFVGDTGRDVIRETYGPRDMAGIGMPASLQQQAAIVLAGSAGQSLQYTGPPRAIVHIDRDVLVGIARNAEAVIVLQCAVGDTLSSGTPILQVFGNRSDIEEPALLSAIHLVAERGFVGDPKYAIRLLVDMAIMALSPAVNDPTTAVQSLDELEDLLHRLGGCDLDTGYVVDGERHLRVIIPVPTWDDYLSLALDEIRIYGAESLQVLRRLRSALVDLSETLEDDGRRLAAQRYLHHLDAEIETSHLDATDQATARERDPQGLGLTRKSP